MPRLFTALEVPAPVGTELMLLRGGIDGARWVEPESYHVTLTFIGDIDDALARDVAEALDGVRRPEVAVELAELDAFGGRRPRSVHAAVRPLPALMELQEAQERLLRRVGAPLEARAFTPHVTLARLSGATRAPDVAAFLARHGPLGLAFTAERFVLMSSRSSTGGGPYAVEVAYPLESA